ncbi:hypothetical protein JMJ35_002725 [Cladonia borealis]|uniref:Uncharacterized protein n=1 Tax=Cladonia borealis TaxID=184061 RepID=A0AA39R8D1_9LECA|nr:hypothetical protein JMJ35_002725 [Cladonia borealis]
MASTHQEKYLDRFPGFQGDPRRPLNEEFARLASFKQWRIGSKVYKREHTKFLRAELDLHLGVIEQCRKLEDWQVLCQELRVSPIPASITQCKKALHKVHVNIIDLIDSRRQGTQVKIFATTQKLVSYTRATGNIFPKTKAKENVLLKVLLRRVF